MKMTRWLLMGLLCTPGLAWAQDGKSAEDEKPKGQGQDKPAAAKVDGDGPGQSNGKLEREIQSAHRKMQQAQQELQRELQRGARQREEAAKQREEAAKQREAALAATQKVRNGSAFTLARSFPSVASARLLAIYGFDLAEADPVLKAQLKLPAEQGLVVTRVVEKGLADEAGLKENDLIVKLDDKDAGRPEQVREAFGKAGTTAVHIKLIRAGEPRELSLVGPSHGERVMTPTYWIGVNVAPVDATLRAQLTFLPAEAGLIATEVVADSPAVKAGMQKSDILVKIDDKPLKDQETMVGLIQKAEGKPVAVELFRAGKPQTLTVTPAKRTVTQVFTMNSDQLFKVDGDGPKRFSITIPFDNVNGPALREDRLRGLDGVVLKDLDQIIARGVRREGQQGGTAEADSKLRKEVQELSGKIDALEKLIRELAKDRPGGKETKD